MAPIAERRGVCAKFPFRCILLSPALQEEPLNSVALFCSFIQAIAAHEDVDLVRSLRFPF